MADTQIELRSVLVVLGPILVACSGPAHPTGAPKTRTAYETYCVPTPTLPGAAEARHDHEERVKRHAKPEPPPCGPDGCEEIVFDEPPDDESIPELDSEREYPELVRPIQLVIEEGLRAWEASCPGHTLEQGCLDLTEEPARGRCGEGPVQRIKSHPRDAALATAALANMRCATTLLGELPKNAGGANQESAAATMHFVLGSHAFHVFVNEAALPSGDQAAIASWVEQQRERIGAMGQLLDKARSGGSGLRWVPAAPARRALAWDIVLDQLARAPIPPGLSPEDATTYCADLVSPLGEDVWQRNYYYGGCISEAERYKPARAWADACRSPFRAQAHLPEPFNSIGAAPPGEQAGPSGDRCTQVAWVSR